MRLITIILIFIYIGSFAQNNSKVDSLLTVLNNSENKSDKYFIYYNLFLEYHLCCPDIALEFALKKLDIAIFMNDKEWIANSENMAGLVLYEKSNYTEALKHFKTASDLYLELDDQEGISTVYNNMGMIYADLKNKKKAIYYYQKSIEINKKISDTLNVDYEYSNIGLIYGQNARDYMALLNTLTNKKHIIDYNKIQKDINEIKSNVLFIDTLENRLKLSTNKNDSISIIEELVIANSLYALELFNKALKISEAKNSPEGICIRYENIGWIYKVLEDYDNAENYLKKALAIADKNQLYTSKSNIISNIAELNFRRGNTKVAIKNYLLAVDIAKQNNLKSKLQAAYLGLSDTYKAKNDYHNAFTYYVQYKQTADSILNMEKIQSIYQLQNKFELSSKQKEVDLKNLELKRQNLIRYALIVIILLNIIIILIILKIYSIKNKANKELRQKNELINKQKELLQHEKERKVRELTESTLKIASTSEFIDNLKESISKLNVKSSGFNDSVKALKQQIKLQENQDIWNEFQQHFNEVHPEFYKKLTAKYPELTQSDLKICALLLLNLNTKEIANLTHKTPKSIEVIRSRIRKKLDITRDENLFDALVAINN